MKENSIWNREMARPEENVKRKEKKKKKYIYIYKYIYIRRKKRENPDKKQGQKESTRTNKKKRKKTSCKSLEETAHTGGATFHFIVFYWPGSSSGAVLEQLGYATFQPRVWDFSSDALVAEPDEIQIME